MRGFRAKGERMANKKQPTHKAKESRKAHKPARRATAGSTVVRMSSIFTVRNQDIERLSAMEAVELIRDLLWAEAQRLGLPTTSINISTLINVPDGGIDATVEGNTSNLKSPLIRPGLTSYQIKANSEFKPWNDSDIRKELFGKGKVPSKENLGESIRACLDRKGTYILVCTKVDLAAPQQDKTVSLIKNYFSTCGYKSAKLDVWSQNKLIGLLQRFPSLSLKINQREGLRFQTHKGWSQQDDMKRSFKAGDQQRLFIANLQTELNRNDEAVHVRVIGEPGIGKTRLVLEATTDDLAPLVLYCDSAAKFRDSELMNEILKEDNEFIVILVVDECDPDARSYIWNKLKHVGPRLKVVSIYNEADETGGNIVYATAPPLAKDEIISIIQEYGVPKDKADRWADMCDGFPRVAHVMGWNLKNNPDDLLKPPDTVNIWERYIVGGDDRKSERVEQRRVVLRHLALFKRFGYGSKVLAEAKTIAAVIQKAHPSITWARFLEIVDELRGRKILQGESTLYITPKLLHIKFWADWWDTYGQGFDFQGFAKRLPGKLLDWFYEMFKYAAESEAASRVVSNLLGENGPFQAGNYLLDPKGARFFLALSEANPKAALECLKNTIGTWSKEDLLTFTTGRREVVWALERIVMWRDLFHDAGRILVKLGEAEIETWANNASGLFAGLFSMGPGPVAPTEASPEERLPLLKEVLDSESNERRRLALKACDNALESYHFTRAAGAEQQGLKREPELWMPRTYGEIFDAYRRVWQLLWERMDTLPRDEQEEATGILLGRAQGLARYQNLFDMVIDTLTELAKKPYADRKKIIQAVQRVLHYDTKDMPAEMRSGWQRLRASLIGDDFHSLMERYVGMDLLEETLDEASEPLEGAEHKISQLAAESVGQPKLLHAELPWLVTDSAKNGYRFGYVLATKDEGLLLLPSILDAVRNAGANGSGFFLGGYLRAIYERNPQAWEGLLDEIAQDGKLHTWVPELTWRSGMSDRAALRILNLAKQGLLSTQNFQMFGFGSVIRDLSEDVFKQWIDFLLSKQEEDAVLTAVNLYHFYYARNDSSRPLPEDLTLSLLIAPSLFKKGQRRHRSEMKDYDWTEIAKAFVGKYPQRSLELADVMLEHFGEDGTIMEGFYSQPQAVLAEITARFPREVWKKVVKYLGPPIDSRAYHITSWLRGGELHARGKGGVLPLISLDELWRWVDADVEKRAWYLASFVPKQLFCRNGEVCLAREVLVRYGGRKEVRTSLMANFSTESWAGPESLHYQTKKQWLLDYKKEENNENVKRWIDEYVASLDQQIERARIEEERE